MINLLRQLLAYTLDKLRGRQVIRFGAPLRSPDWARFRRSWLELHPTCQACSSQKDLEVHHIQPFHLHPHLELDLDNLITLCGRCHFAFGHLYSWRSFNIEVRKDAAAFLQKCRNRP